MSGERDGSDELWRWMAGSGDDDAALLLAAVAADRGIPALPVDDVRGRLLTAARNAATL